MLKEKALKEKHLLHVARHRRLNRKQMKNLKRCNYQHRSIEVFCFRVDNTNIMYKVSIIGQILGQKSPTIYVRDFLLYFGQH
jgi:hypothetical protein